MKCFKVFLTGLACCVLPGAWTTAQAQDLLRISEFMAVNDGPLTDEDGAKSDWIEIHNAGANTVDLYGWYLTDSFGTLRKWKFPSTNLPPNHYLLVWASNKDRHATGASLQRLSLTQYGNDGTNWIAAVPNAGGNFTSGTPPTISSQPTNQTVLAFAPATFTVVASGTAPLRYQWLCNGTNVPDATNALLVIPHAPPLSDGLYSAVVYNNAGVTVSSNATLNVVLAAAIMAQPASQTVFPLTSVSFAVVAGSTSPLRFQWRYNGSPIANATNATHVIPSVQPSSAGDYSVVVSDAVGSLTSDNARLTVLLAPIITAQPTNQFVRPGSTSSNATFIVGANSSTPLRYQWHFEGSPLLRATNFILSLTNVQYTNAGNYRAVVNDNYGSATSAVAVLSTPVRPVITLQPASQSIAAGGMVSFSAAWYGTLPISHRWRRGTATLTNLAPESGLITAYFSNGYVFGSPTSSVLVLTNVTSAIAANYNLVVSNVTAPPSCSAAMPPSPC